MSEELRAALEDCQSTLESALRAPTLPKGLRTLFVATYAANRAALAASGATLDVERLRRALHEHAVDHRDVLPCNEHCAPDMYARLSGAVTEREPDRLRCGNCPHPPDAHSPVGAETCSFRDCRCPGLLTLAASEATLDVERLRETLNGIATEPTDGFDDGWAFARYLQEQANAVLSDQP